jgi:hypothetical protein
MNPDYQEQEGNQTNPNDESTKTARDDKGRYA